MKRPRYLDFECIACGLCEERFVETNDDGTPCDEQACANPELRPANEDMPEGYCRSPMQMIAVGSPLLKTIVKGNHDYSERERERLTKRSNEHWEREGRHEAIERERKQT